MRGGYARPKDNDDARIRYAVGRVSRPVSSWIPTAIFVRSDECCRV
jgi:hypothetical protein